jgi:hypothetical protein
MIIHHPADLSAIPARLNVRPDASLLRFPAAWRFFGELSQFLQAGALGVGGYTMSDLFRLLGGTW